MLKSSIHRKHTRKFGECSLCTRSVCVVALFLHDWIFLFIKRNGFCSCIKTAQFMFMLYVFESWLNFPCKFGAYLLRLQQQLCIWMVIFFFFLSFILLCCCPCGFIYVYTITIPVSFFFGCNLSFVFSLSLETVPPSVKAVNHVVGAPVESHVLLECIVEVFPKPLNGWYRNEGKQDIMPTKWFFFTFSRFLLLSTFVCWCFLTIFKACCLMFATWRLFYFQTHVLVC